MSARAKPVAAKKARSGEPRTVGQAKRVSSKTPKTSGEMTAAEKKSRVAQKKRLGQPAGKPKRVKPLKRKK
jgi:hypothetical protein